MLRTAEVGLFDWPVGCPSPSDGTRPTQGYVEDWIQVNNPNRFQRTSYGTCAGLVALVVGGVSAAIGFVKKIKLATWAGVILAAIGVVTTAIGKYCGVEFDVRDAAHNNFIYKPSRELETTPDKLGVSHEPVSITTHDGEELKGYYLEAPIETRKTVIYLHGRANNISHHLKEVTEIQKQIPINVLMIDYRGFGESTLKPNKRITEDALAIDADAMYDYLITKRGLSPEDISVYGHSLGGAVAVQLSTRKEIDRLIVDATFTSLKDVGKDYFYSIVPKSWVGKVAGDEFNSIEAIKKIKAKKVCVIHGTSDNVVPLEHSARLFGAIDKPKEIIVLEGANHSNCRECILKSEDHTDKLRKFFGIEAAAASA